MVNEDKKLEDSLRNLANTPSKETSRVEMSTEQEIGFHKGSLNTLAAERNELVKMVGNVEAIMQSHLKRLEQLGVNFRKE